MPDEVRIFLLVTASIQFVEFLDQLSDYQLLKMEIVINDIK
jgi:hypothetical protein